MIALVVVILGVSSVLVGLNHVTERKRLRKDRERHRRQTLDLDILRLADAEGGRITAMEVAMERSVPPEVAVAALGALVLRGVATVEVTDAGVLVYGFYDIAHLDDGSSARGVLGE